jgi:hypothetical protein
MYFNTKIKENLTNVFGALQYEILKKKKMCCVSVSRLSVNKITSTLPLTHLSYFYPNQKNKEK